METLASEKVQEWEMNLYSSFLDLSLDFNHLKAMDKHCVHIEIVNGNFLEDHNMAPVTEYFFN